MGLTEAELALWRKAAATLREEEEAHAEEWRERRKRRAELEQAIAARRAELRAGRRAERTKSDALRESVAKFVEQHLASQGAKECG